MVSHITYINPEASLWKFSFLSLLYLKPHCLVHPNSTGMSFQYLLSNNLKCMIYYHHSKLLLICAHELDSLKTLVGMYHYPCPYPRIPFTPFSFLFTLWTLLCRLRAASGENDKNTELFPAPCAAFGEQRGSQLSFLKTRLMFSFSVLPTQNSENTFWNASETHKDKSVLSPGGRDHPARTSYCHYCWHCA